MSARDRSGAAEIDDLIRELEVMAAQREAQAAAERLESEEAQTNN